MKANVFKVETTYKNKKGEEKHYTKFFLYTDSGVRIRIEPYIYVDNDGVSHFGELDKLSIIADSTDELPF